MKSDLFNMDVTTLILGNVRSPILNKKINCIINKKKTVTIIEN